MKELAKALIYALVGVLLCLNVYQCHRNGQMPTSGVYTDTVRVTVYDTIAYHQPAPKVEKTLGSITAKLPVAVPKTPESVPNSRKNTENGGESVPNFVDKDEIAAHLTNEASKTDSVDVAIPITQSVYENNLYRAYVSGYRASLDSLFIYQPTQIVRIREKPKRWGVGIQTGYGISPKGFQPYIGIGITYNLFYFR